MKKFFMRVTFFVYFFICFSSFFTMYAHAYIDPSAVTYVIQAVAAVFIALGAFLTIFRHRIAKFFKKSQNTEKKKIHVDEDIAVDEVVEEDK